MINIINGIDWTIGYLGRQKSTTALYIKSTIQTEKEKFIIGMISRFTIEKNK